MTSSILKTTHYRTLYTYTTNTTLHKTHLRAGVAVFAVVLASVRRTSTHSAAAVVIAAAQGGEVGAHAAVQVVAVPA